SEKTTAPIAWSAAWTRVNPSSEVRASSCPAQPPPSHSAARGQSYSMLSRQPATGRARVLSRKGRGHSRPQRRCASILDRSREGAFRTGGYCAARIVGAVVRGDTGELTGGLGDSNVRCAPSQDCREGCQAGTKLHGHCPS